MEIYQKILNKLKTHKKLLITAALLVLIPVTIVAMATNKPSEEETPDQPRPQQITPPKEGVSTIAPTEIDTEDQIKKQEEADENFRSWEEEVDKNYPWLESLPIQTEEYYVYFDLDKKAFVGLLYPKTSSTESVDAQVEKMKKEIITSLANIGVVTSQYKFEWTVSPKP